MNSFQYTVSPVKNKNAKKSIKYGNNHKGVYYSNVPIAIPNNYGSNTQFSTRIESNMTNLTNNLNAANKEYNVFVNSANHDMTTSKDVEYSATTLNEHDIADSLVGGLDYMNKDFSGFIPSAGEAETKIISTALSLGERNIADKMSSNLGKSTKTFNTFVSIDTLNSGNKTFNSFIRTVDKNNVYDNDVNDNDVIERQVPDKMVETMHKMKEYEEYHKAFDENSNHLDYNNFIVKYILETTTKLVHVFQRNYNNGRINSTGVGDFIRGSYFIIQFCEKHGLQYVIDFSKHPISQFLHMFAESFNPDVKPSANVNKFSGSINIFEPANKHEADTLMADFAFYASSQLTHNSTKYVYTIAYPVAKIDAKHKAHMRSVLKPTTQFEATIAKEMTSLKIAPRKYIVLHVRCGDSYLINNRSMNNIDNLHMFKKELENLNANNTYLLISDSALLKKIVAATYPFIKMNFHEITHTGEGLIIDSSKLRNTMIDFYLISLASSVVSFSVYQHGSGFSRWCAETFEVPYKWCYMR